MTQSSIDFLIVDDDPVFTQMLERALNRRGFSSKIAGDLSQALSMARAFHFARALVDLKLGSESGLQLIGELKTLQADLAIVMLTGYSSISTAVDAIKLGATQYLCKPASAEEIIAAFSHYSQPSATAHPEYTHISVERLEWEHIQKVLQEHQGNISATARSLGMHRRTLQRKLQKRPVHQ